MNLSILAILEQTQGGYRLVKLEIYYGFFVVITMSDYGFEIFILFLFEVCWYQTLLIGKHELHLLKSRPIDLEICKVKVVMF